MLDLQPWHSYVKLTGFTFEPYREIQLRFDDHIVIMYSYADELPSDCKPLTELDHTGCGLATVPRYRIEKALSDEDMIGVWDCEYADNQMLLNAR